MEKLILQSIVIKNKPFNESFKIAYDISNKFLIPDFKTNSIRFRVEEPNKFIKTSFRTKKITDNISLIFGKYKKQYQKDLIKGGYLTLYDYNNTSKKTLKTLGNIRISKIDIVRAPISNMINKFLDVITSNKFSQLMKKYGYDKFFHLQLLLTLENGKSVSVEKNEQIYVKDKPIIKRDSEFLNVPLKNKNITVNQLLENTKNRIGPKTYFDYSAFYNNCQNYLKYILESNDLLNNENDKFIFQPVDQLVAELPSYVPKIANLATKSASLISLFTGKGYEFEDSESEEDNNNFYYWDLTK